MKYHIIVTYVLLSAISATTAQNNCFYNTTENLEFLECTEPAEKLAGIFISGTSFPHINKRLLSPFTNLINIDISRTNIEKIEPGSFHGLKLKVLKLNDNSIKTIEYGTFNSLNTTTMLELAGNQIESLEANIFHGMTSLAWISLSGNKIKTINKSAFNGLESLEYLHIIWNKIESLEVGTFDSLINLELLDLTLNSLTEVKFGLFSKQRHLNKLNLQQNRIEHLPDGLFNNLTAIKIIDVSQNKLHELHEHLFVGTENLKELKFNSNNITQFDSQRILVHLPNLQSVELYNNPWNCEILKKIKDDFTKKHVISPVPVPVQKSPNVDGVRCKE